MVVLPTPAVGPVMSSDLAPSSFNSPTTWVRNCLKAPMASRVFGSSEFSTKTPRLHNCWKYPAGLLLLKRGFASKCCVGVVTRLCTLKNHEKCCCKEVKNVVFCQVATVLRNFYRKVNSKIPHHSRSLNPYCLPLRHTLNAGVTVTR